MKNRVITTETPVHATFEEAARRLQEHLIVVGEQFERGTIGAKEYVMKVNEFAWKAGFGVKADEPNARLIAAAPDLLEALHKLAAEVSGLRAFESELRVELGNTNWNVLMLRLSEADAAIAKAEGRT